MWKTNIDGYSMFTKEEENLLKKQEKYRKKNTLDFINDIYEDNPDKLKLLDEEKLLLFRNEFDDSNLFKKDIEFLNEYQISWANFICKDKDILFRYKKMVKENSSSSPFKILMDLRDSLIENEFILLPIKLKKSPKTEDEYRSLHIFLQKIFYEPFKYHQMNLVERAITEGYNTTNIFDAHLRYNKMEFRILMKKLPYIVNEINNIKNKEKEVK